MSTIPVLDLQPVLNGSTLLLRPLRADDVESLYAVASDPLVWEQHPDPLRYQRAVFEPLFHSGIDSKGALVVIERSSGLIIGWSRYYDWNPDTREVAIGYTFLARSHWGGSTNRELKQLMLRHAFTQAKVVWFHVGKDNTRSRMAMAKIGGKLVYEGPWDNNGQISEYAFFTISASDDNALLLS